MCILVYVMNDSIDIRIRREKRCTCCCCLCWIILSAILFVIFFSTWHGREHYMERLEINRLHRENAIMTWDYCAGRTPPPYTVEYFNCEQAYVDSKPTKEQIELQSQEEAIAAMISHFRVFAWICKVDDAVCAMRLWDLVQRLGEWGGPIIVGSILCLVVFFLAVFGPLISLIRLCVLRSQRKKKRANSARRQQAMQQPVSSASSYLSLPVVTQNFTGESDKLGKEL